MYMNYGTMMLIKSDYTFNKRNKAKLVQFNGNKTLDQWGYKFKEWSNKK